MRIPAGGMRLHCSPRRCKARFAAGRKVFRPAHLPRLQLLFPQNLASQSFAGALLKTSFSVAHRAVQFAPNPFVSPQFARKPLLCFARASRIRIPLQAGILPARRTRLHPQIPSVFGNEHEICIKGSQKRFACKDFLGRGDAMRQDVRRSLLRCTRGGICADEVEATGFEPTTFWSLTASEQAMLARRSLRFRQTLAAAPPIPMKALLCKSFTGALNNERVWQRDQKAKAKLIT